ncbi:hypothetical protein N7462_011667 [Penicillium macrosclerotiorum]|uniref:uncharacterized protein n=1 Tax=Penicillium macrosclerotiorum TaxID=303699 RepID=UPI0025478888|nr:uncharacterized protein N7462_011667 [Penicillium macrosclerotiorum]KAJ5662741.1 hypothetical protein N7462_011667 [Penicillium macrosclerotiorum]
MATSVIGDVFFSPAHPTNLTCSACSVASATSDLKTDESSKLNMTNHSAMNGHTSSPANANGTTTAASPPKSPASAAPQTETPAPSAPAEPACSNQSTAPQETQASEKAERATPIVPSASPENSISHTPRPAPASSSGGIASGPFDGSADSSDKMAVDGPQGTTGVKTELPHHPSTEPGTPSLPALQTDHEMKDAPSAPLSPSKVSREREMDPAEEPAAKRTKVEPEDGTVDFKQPELPTPAAETPGPAAQVGESSITKMQHKFLVKCLTSLKRMHDARFYKVPVDPITLNIPNYHNVITRPMDLGTMEKKLKANEYPSPQAVKADFALMVDNANKFNGPDHVVSQEGRKLQATFEKQMLNMPRPDEVEEKKPKKMTEKTSAARREPRTSTGGLPVPAAAPAPVQPPAPAPKATSPQSTTFALGPEGLPVIRRDSSNPDGRPKRSIHPPKRDMPYSTKPKKKKYQWELRFCQDVLEELHKPKHQMIALPFYYPVDPVALNIPTYHSVIKKPMDLSTIKSKLTTGQYENSKEFEVDIRLMFKNCYRFNLPGDPTYLAGQSLEATFDEKWQQKAAYLEKHEPHPEHNSDSSEDDSDEDVDESDDDDARLSQLQKQIAEMSRQVEMITQNKKKTPPAKKAKSKSTGKKDPKKSSSGKKDKKSKSFSGKPEKRNITYHEKQIISNGISSLPDKKMQEALGIIQKNVPALKGTQEAEIELDIDELPNDVLLLLLKFVKKNCPNIMDDEDDAPVSSVAAPKPKKNKPMSKYEQEAQINMLESNLSRFQGGGGSPVPMPSVEANETSEDESDDDSEESEEE